MTAGRWRLLIYLVDLGGLTGALFLSSWAKAQLPLGQTVPAGTTFITPFSMAIVLGIWSFYGSVARLYDARKTVNPMVKPQRLIAVLVLTSITFMAVVFLLKYQHFSRLLLVYFTASAPLLLISLRLALWVVWRWLCRANWSIRRVAIAGAGDLGRYVASALERQPWANVRVVGCLGNSSLNGFPLLGSLQEAQKVVESHSIDELVVALGEANHRQVEELVHQLQWTPVKIKVVPDYLQLATIRAEVQEVAGIPLLELRPTGIGGFDALVKRALDISGAIVGLVTLWPLMLLIGLVIKLDSPGSILFRQTRIGQNCRPFTVLKFRTMEADAPPIPPLPGRPEDVGKATIKVAPDNPYITRAGRLLRRYSLDELPQLWNVLKGEMSLVGPRPEVAPVVHLYSSWHLKRLAVKPGITGPMQVNGRSELPVDERVKLELAYIENYSLWEDLKLVAQTLHAVLSPRGAY